MKSAALKGLFCLATVALLPSPSAANKHCLPEAMARCTDPLKVVTDNKDLGFATSRSELEKMCPKLMDGLRCIDEFTYRCLDNEHRNYFNTLYHGTTQVIIDLCQEGAYQSDYLRHAPCMRQVQAGYERCADDYQVRIQSLNKNNPKQQQQPGEEGSEENVQMLCCSFQQYLHCSERVVNNTCGYETARFTKSFLDRMSGPLIQGHCQEHGSSSACIDLMAVEEGHHPVAIGKGHQNHQNHQEQPRMDNNGGDQWGRRPGSYPYSADVSKAGCVGVSVAATTLSAVLALVASRMLFC